MSVTASPVFSFSSSRSLSSVTFSRKFSSRSAGALPTAVHRRHQFAQVADAALGHFRVFFQPPQFGEVAGLVQKIIRPAEREIPHPAAPLLPSDGQLAIVIQLALRALHKFHKRLDALARVRLKRRRHQRIFHRGEDGTFPLVARAEQPFHRHVAQAARGHVGDAQQADVVVRIEKHFQIGEEILDLAPVKKALPADQMITHAGLAQFRFQRTRLLVRAKQNRAILPRNPVREPLEFDLPDDFARLVLVVRRKSATGFSRPCLSATKAICRAGARCF